MSEKRENITNNELVELRRELDDVDNELIALFQKRLDIAVEIGAYKRVHGLKLTDEKREAQKLDSINKTVNEERLPAAQRLVRFLMDEAKQAQRACLNVYLIGMPDCGKTRIGKRLSKLMGMPLADTDKLIMQNVNLSIDDIFAQMGEETFRSMEALMLMQIIKEGGFIVASGGGMPLWGNNAELMKNSGITVFLDRRLDALIGQNTRNRPLLRDGGDVEGNIKRLYAERRPKYFAAADFTADPDSPGSAEKIAEIAKQILTGK